ncbi:nuclear transport factor 2 family protein [Jatrophihabitans fulvus]
MELWELEAREQIRITCWTYNVAGDSGRVDELAAQFTEDGVLQLADGAEVGGRAAIARMLRDHAERGAPADGSPGFFVRHHTTDILTTEVSTDRAQGVAYFAVYTPDGPDHWGRYRDSYARVGDRWLIAHRRARVDSFTPGGWFSRVYATSGEGRP